MPSEIATQRLKDARAVVGEFESLSPNQLRRLGQRRDFAKHDWNYTKAKCLLDFWTFVKHGAKYPMAHYSGALHGMTKNDPPYPVEYGMSHFLTHWTKEENGIEIPVPMKVVEVSREHCKTQLGPIAFGSWIIGRDPDVRIALRSHILPKAQEILGGLKGLLNKEAYKAVFPWVEPYKVSKRTVQWDKTAIIVDRVNKELRTPTVEAGGVDTQYTGGHYEWLFYDDFETEDSANSIIERAKLENRIRHDVALATGGTRWVIWGTPYNVKAIMAQALRGSGVFEERLYDLFKAPCMYEAIPSALRVEEPWLGPDRVTLHVGDHEFAGPSLNLHQAKVEFYSEHRKDIVTEIREVVDSSSEHVTVNRPFDTTLNEPLSVIVDKFKPTLPERFTLDRFDVFPADFEDTGVARSSLLERKAGLGSHIFQSQFMINPLDPENCLFRRDQIKLVTEEDVPRGNVFTYRTCDLAGPKRRGSKTAIASAIHHESGIYFIHFFIGDKTKTQTLWELFIRMNWLKQNYRQEFKWTSFETAGREEFLREDLTIATRDPNAYFRQIPQYVVAADREFEAGKRMNMSSITVPRGGWASKETRIASMQSTFESNQIHFVSGIEHCEEVIEYVEMYNPAQGEDNEGLDILDCIADHVREGKVPRAVEEKPVVPGSDFLKLQKEAMMRQGMAKASKGQWIA